MASVESECDVPTPSAEWWCQELLGLAEAVKADGVVAELAQRLGSAFISHCKTDPVDNLQTALSGFECAVLSAPAKGLDAGDLAIALAHVAVCAAPASQSKAVQPERVFDCLSSADKSALQSKAGVVFDVITKAQQESLLTAAERALGVQLQGPELTGFARGLLHSYRQNPPGRGRQAKDFISLVTNKSRNLFGKVDAQAFLATLLRSNRMGMVSRVIAAAPIEAPAGAEFPASQSALQHAILSEVEQSLKDWSCDHAVQKAALKCMKQWKVHVDAFPTLAHAANKAALKFAASARNPDVLSGYLSALPPHWREKSLRWLQGRISASEKESKTSTPGQAAAPEESTPSSQAREAASPACTPIMSTPTAAKYREQSAVGEDEDSDAAGGGGDQDHVPDRLQTTPKLAKTVTKQTQNARLLRLERLLSQEGGAIANIQRLCEEEAPAPEPSRLVHWCSELAPSESALLHGVPVGFACASPGEADDRLHRVLEQGSLAGLPQPVLGRPATVCNDGRCVLPENLPVYWVDTLDALVALSDHVPPACPVGFDAEWTMGMGLLDLQGGSIASRRSDCACLLQYAWPTGVALLDWKALVQAAETDTQASEAAPAAVGSGETSCSASAQAVQKLFGPSHSHIASFAGSGDCGMLSGSPLGVAFTKLASQTNWYDTDKESKRLFQAVDAVQKQLPASAASILLQPLPEKPPQSLTATHDWLVGGGMCKFWQVSDWLRRPLLPGQAHYGALDAYGTLMVCQVLLEVEGALKEAGLPVDWAGPRKASKKGDKAKYKKWHRKGGARRGRGGGRGQAAK